MTSCAEALLDKHWNGCLPVSVDSITDNELYIFTYSQEEYENSCLMHYDDINRKLCVHVKYTSEAVKQWMSIFCLHPDFKENLLKKPGLKMHFSSEVFKYSNTSYRKYNDFVLSVLVPEKALSKTTGINKPNELQLAEQFGINKTAIALRLKLRH